MCENPPVSASRRHKASYLNCHFFSELLFLLYRSNNYIAQVHVHGYVRVCVSLCVCRQVCVKMEATHQNSISFSAVLLSFFETESLTELGSHSLAKLYDHKPQGPPVSVSTMLEFQEHITTPILLCMEI